MQTNGSESGKFVVLVAIEIFSRGISRSQLIRSDESAVEQRGATIRRKSVSESRPRASALDELLREDRLHLVSLNNVCHASVIHGFCPS